MLNGQRIVVVMPAYNAAGTLEQTVAEVPRDVVDDIIVVDDASHDDTAEVARRLNLHTLVHERNRGYGGNQKTCYAEALARGADVVVMVHPDYQYSPRLIAAMASMIAYGEYDAALGSRILRGSAWNSGMPRWKYIANRGLTLGQNMLMDTKMSEYHTGFRAFSRRVLETLPLDVNSDDFVFDNQMLAQVVWYGFNLGELSCPSRYEPGSSSINFRRSVVYGLGVVGTAVTYRLARWGWSHSPLFPPPPEG
ncbi:MAG: glycosyltransferase family 2 protein [Armatimonadetes bacterium]|nr:glycosyltransferase family 2 protein [Armatimonadota bacterium]